MKASVIRKLAKAHSLSALQAGAEAIAEREEDPVSPDEQSVECLCNLMLQVGRQFQRWEETVKNPSYNRQMPRVMSVIKRLNKCGSLEVRLRFLCQDVIEAEQNGWRLRGQHVAALQTTVTQEEF